MKKAVYQVEETAAAAAPLELNEVAAGMSALVVSRNTAGAIGAALGCRVYGDSIPGFVIGAASGWWCGTFVYDVVSAS